MQVPDTVVEIYRLHDPYSARVTRAGETGNIVEVELRRTITSTAVKPQIIKMSTHASLKSVAEFFAELAKEINGDLRNG